MDARAEERSYGMMMVDISQGKGVFFTMLYWLVLCVNLTQAGVIT
jgi:hypothetical protein